MAPGRAPPLSSLDLTSETPSYGVLVTVVWLLTGWTRSLDLDLQRFSSALGPDNTIVLHIR